MNLPVFQRNAACKACPLHEGVRTVCVKTAAYGNPSGKARAILITGEAPGAQEDAQGIPFIGRSGQVLRNFYIKHFKLHQDSDVYIANSVRCRPPQNTDPTEAQVSACNGYLMADIRELQRCYKEVVLLCVGRWGAFSIWGKSLTKALSLQGEQADLHAHHDKSPQKAARISQTLYDLTGSPDMPKPVQVFSTYHPAYTFRNANAKPTIIRHLKYLQDSLMGGVCHVLDRDKLSIRPCWSISGPVDRLSLDIETYGKIASMPPQTQFHPVKSIEYDKVPKDKLVWTTGLSWRDESGALQHSIYLMNNTYQRTILWANIWRITRQPNFEGIVGQNLPFDLMYLRYCYPAARKVLDYPVPLLDLMITNYLHDEGRPEKSLKALSDILRTAKYDPEEGAIRYKSINDPELHKYNCLDTASALVNVEKLEAEIRLFYGKDTPKLSAFTRLWYTQLLWLVIWMQESGISHDKEYLERLLKHYEARLAKLENLTKAAWDIPLKGKGSVKAQGEILDGAIDKLVALKISVPPLIKTPKTKAISRKEENRNALLEALPRGTEEAQRLRFIGHFSDTGGILSRYLQPILLGRDGGRDPTPRLIQDICYPRIYPVPSEWEDTGGGGTKQARIVFKGPAIQTYPPQIKRAINCRFPGGSVIWWDYSQLELVVSGLMSGDPYLLENYRTGGDIHESTAVLIWGPDIVNHSRFKRVYRFAGKVANFLIIYRGGAKRLHLTLLKEAGFFYSIKDCQAAIRKIWARHQTLWDWQEKQIDFVRQHGYYILPLIGQSRLFLGAQGKIGRPDEENEIVNMPIQAIAADITLSAQFHLSWAMKKAGLKSLQTLNVYDSGAIEVYPGESKSVQSLMAEHVLRPPFFADLCDTLGWTCPLAYEWKETPC